MFPFIFAIIGGAIILFGGLSLKKDNGGEHTHITFHRGD